MNDEIDDREFVKLYPKPEGFVPDPNFPIGHRHFGSARCQKWSSRNNRQCLRLAMDGKDFCYTHGGASLKGIASGQWKHGSYSTYLPKRMQEHYEREVRDPDLLSLTSEIGVLKARMYDLLQRVDTGEAGELWRLARQSFDDLTRALSSRDPDALNNSMANLGRTIARGQSDYKAWDEIKSSMSLLQRLEESERKRRVEMQTMLHLTDVYSLFKAYATAARETVSDPDELRRLAERFAQLARSSGMIGNMAESDDDPMDDEEF